jgi:hypothetical protein
LLLLEKICPDIVLAINAFDWDKIEEERKPYPSWFSGDDNHRDIIRYGLLNHRLTSNRFVLWWDQAATPVFTWFGRGLPPVG